MSAPIGMGTSSEQVRRGLSSWQKKDVTIRGARLLPCTKGTGPVQGTGSYKAATVQIGTLYNDVQCILERMTGLTVSHFTIALGSFLRSCEAILQSYSYMDDSVQLD